MRFVDANVLIHAAVDQDPRAHQHSSTLVDKLQRGQEDVFVTELVLAEVAASLRSARTGRLSHAQIAEFLRPLLSLPSVHMLDKQIWPRSLELFEIRRVDLADAHIMALIERDGNADVYSFDTDFDRIPGIRRVEP